MSGDPIINSILDHFLAATGIDPSYVEPDQRLRADLFLTQPEVDAFIKGLLMDGKLGLPPGFEFSRSMDLTLKQMHREILKARASNKATA